MRRSMVMVGTLLGAALAVTGCRQRVEPVDRDVNISHHQTARAGFAHHRPFREGRRHRSWLSAVRARATPDVPEPGRAAHRPPVRLPNGCATVREPGHGVAVRCVRRSGDDVDQSHDTILRGPDEDDGESED